jgi:hypothetical protein
VAPGQDGAAELEQQRAEIEEAFRELWVPPRKPQVLTERACAAARKPLAQGRRTWLDQTTIEAVRDGAQPGDPLPPRRPGTYLDRGTDAEVIIIGRGSALRVAVKFSHEDFPYARSVTGSSQSPPAGAAKPSGSWNRSRPVPCTG